jgi:hypothetical protein
VVESETLARFVQNHSIKPEKVALINASPMIDLVENGSFLFSPAETQDAATRFIGEVFQRHPLIDVLTLSSSICLGCGHFLKRPALTVVFWTRQRMSLLALEPEQQVPAPTIGDLPTNARPYRGGYSPSIGQAVARILTLATSHRGGVSRKPMTASTLLHRSGRRKVDPKRPSTEWRSTSKQEP